MLFSMPNVFFNPAAFTVAPQRHPAADEPRNGRPSALKGVAKATPVRGVALTRERSSVTTHDDRQVSIAYASNRLLARTVEDGFSEVLSIRSRHMHSSVRMLDLMIQAFRAHDSFWEKRAMRDWQDAWLHTDPGARCVRPEDDWIVVYRNGRRQFATSSDTLYDAAEYAALDKPINEGMVRDWLRRQHQFGRRVDVDIDFDASQALSIQPVADGVQGALSVRHDGDSEAIQFNLRCGRAAEAMEVGVALTEQVLALNDVLQEYKVIAARLARNDNDPVLRQRARQLPSRDRIERLRCQIEKRVADYRIVFKGGLPSFVRAA